MFERAGHFLYLDEPDRFVALLENWISTTDPGVPDEEHFRALLRDRGG